MTDTTNLGLPFIEGSQAQKHVTHNEALRILDAAIQIAVRDRTRTSPPLGSADGQRHVVAGGATGAWAGHGNAIATWQDGAWAFLSPRTGWCVWSVADDVMLVFDGAAWRDLRDLPVTLNNAALVGINTTASAPNLLSVKSNAALFSAVNAAAGGSGDVRLQLSKESATKTASVYFSDNYSGRAEFGLVGSDEFKLKVSADGATWVEAICVGQGSGNLALPRGVALTGVIAPAQLTASQNDYNPAGLASASVVQISSDAARSISGLAAGAEGRIVSVINVGGQPITLLDESASSSAANRFTLGGNVTIASRQAAMLRYDGTASRWQAIAAPGLRAVNNLSDLANAATARGNLGVGTAALRNIDDYPRTDAVQSLTAAQQAQARANIGAVTHNMVTNGRFSIDQRNAGLGATIADNAFWADRWRYLGEASATCGARQNLLSAARFDGFVQFAGTSDKGGIFQVVEGVNCREHRGGQVTLSAVIAVTTPRLGNIKMAICEWTGTENATTADPVAAWGADGVTPTLAAGWSFITTPANLGISTAAAQVSLTATCGASMNNLAVMIWNDDRAYGAGDVFIVTDVQLEAGPVAGRYTATGAAALLQECQRFFWKQSETFEVGVTQFTDRLNNVVSLPVEMRALPTRSGGTYTASSGNAGTVSTDITNRRLVRFGNSGTPWTVGVVLQVSGASFSADI